MKNSDLAGRRIMVVEDEFLLCLDICEQIELCDGIVVGPATSLAKGQALLQDNPHPEGAILNIRLGNDLVYPLADALMAAGVPIIFASSESKVSIPQEYESIPIIAKPVDMILVARHLFAAR